MNVKTRCGDYQTRNNRIENWLRRLYAYQSTISCWKLCLLTLKNKLRNCPNSIKFLLKNKQFFAWLWRQKNNHSLWQEIHSLKSNKYRAFVNRLCTTYNLLVIIFEICKYINETITQKYNFVNYQLRNYTDQPTK